MFIRNTLLICIGLLMAGVMPCSAQGIITTIAGGGTLTKSSSNGAPATSAKLTSVAGIATDMAGNCYLTQTGAVRMINTSGIINTVAGIDTLGYAGDGNPATDAGLGICVGVATDHSGKLYIADVQNHVIRKVDAAGFITTYAGNGVRGSAGNGGPAISCELGDFSDMAVDKDDNLYIADYFNHVVWKINGSGIINIVAGSFVMGNSGDGGPATAAQLSYPSGVAVDKGGNIYIADGMSNVIRMVSNSGVITTIAGNGTPTYTGDGYAASSATLNMPSGLGMDALGNLYIADASNNVIRKINRDGIISTVAGTAPGYGGDGGPAVSAQLNKPRDVAVDGAGNIYISDYYNMVIRKVTSTLGVDNIGSATFTVYPNPCNGILHLQTTISGQLYLSIENSAGQTVYTTVVEATNGKNVTVALPANLSDGSYVLRYASDFHSGSLALSIVR